MAFDRNRFQAAKLDVNKKVTEEVEKTFKSNSPRGDYHTIDEGKNYFRMMPPHNPDEPSMQAKVIYWLDCKVEEEKDGKPTGKYVIKSRPIFDSRIHGGTPKDIIDEYIQFTKKNIFNTVQDKDEKSRLLAPINGWRDKAGKWNPGILPSQSFVCYATKGDIIPENLGRLELWKRDKDTLEKLNISESSDEPIVTDAFSDPNEGVQFIITKGRDGKGEPYTLISKNTFEAKGGRDITKLYQAWVESQIVPDAVLEKLSEMEPLAKQFKGSYKKTDFERAVEALEMFDEKHGYDTFKDNEFLKIIEEVGGYYVSTESETSEKKTSPTKSLDLNDMTRDELKSYIKENKLPLTVVSSMSEDIIREMIYDLENTSTDTESETQNESEEKSKTQEEVFEKSSQTESLKERLARLKKNQ